jgi:hypothetical protein
MWKEVFMSWLRIYPSVFTRRNWGNNDYVSQDGYSSHEYIYISPITGQELHKELSLGKKSLGKYVEDSFEDNIKTLWQEW